MADVKDSPIQVALRAAIKLATREASKTGKCITVWRCGDEFETTPEHYHPTRPAHAVTIIDPEGRAYR